VVSEVVSAVERKLRYSERKRLAEEGSLGDLSADVPPPLRVAVEALLQDAPNSNRGKTMLERLSRMTTLHFGRQGNWFDTVRQADTDEFLDMIELACEVAGDTYVFSNRRYVYFPEFETRLNDLMERHRFGYRLEVGQIRKIGSPVLDIEVVGPTLLAVQREGWREVEKEFAKALEHQRGGEVDGALTAANAAVESALKALGFTGNSLGDLAKSFKKSALVPGYLLNVPELLEDLLAKLMAARSTHGDAHGKAPGHTPAEQALADLAVYWAGAFISYLAEVAPGEPLHSEVLSH
jgi:hypothetical protein